MNTTKGLMENSKSMVSDLTGVKSRLDERIEKSKTAKVESAKSLAEMEKAFAPLKALEPMLRELDEDEINEGCEMISKQMSVVIDPQLKFIRKQMQKEEGERASYDQDLETLKKHSGLPKVKDALKELEFASDLGEVSREMFDELFKDSVSPIKGIMTGTLSAAIELAVKNGDIVTEKYEKASGLMAEVLENNKTKTEAKRVGAPKGAVK